VVAHLGQVSPTWADFEAASEAASRWPAWAAPVCVDDDVGAAPLSSRHLSPNQSPAEVLDLRPEAEAAAPRTEPDPLRPTGDRPARSAGLGGVAADTGLVATHHRRAPAVLVAAVVGLAACGSTSSAHRASGPLAPASPQVSVSVSPLSVPSSASGASSPSTPRSAIGLVVDGSGSDLTKPASPTTKALAPGSSGYPTCFGLRDDGFTISYCQKFSSPLGTAVALVEDRATEERTLIWTVSGRTASLALRRVRTLAEPAGSVNAQDGGAEASRTQLSDINNDRVTALIVQTPAAAGAPNPPLAALDIVQASGIVGLHRNLHNGVARKALGGGLETWTPTGAGNAEHTVFEYRAGAWRVVADTPESSDRIPYSTYGQF